MVSFAEDDWFRGLVCSLAALGMILMGYAGYYGFLEERWPDYNVYEDDEDELEKKETLPAVTTNEAVKNEAYESSVQLDQASVVDDKVENVKEYECADL